MASVSGERKRQKTEGDTPNVDLSGELSYRVNLMTLIRKAGRMGRRIQIN